MQEELSIEYTLEQALNYDEGLLDSHYNIPNVHATVNIFDIQQDPCIVEINIYNDKTDCKICKFLGKYFKEYKVFKIDWPKKIGEFDFIWI